MITTFSPAAVEHLGYYVYLLVDPRNDEIFYVGCGKENRLFDHEREYEKTPEEKKERINEERKKLATIQAILNAGMEVEHYIIRHGIKTSKEAFLVESVLINFLTEPRFCEKSTLTNIQAGHEQHRFGIMRAEEIEQLYNAPILEPKHDILCININKTILIEKNRTYSIDKLYEATRKSWRISKNRADKVKFVLTEYRGLIRAVFQVDGGWKYDSNTDRYYFEGKEVTDPAITSLYINHRLPKQRGQANPIRYFDKYNNRK